jgi:hypothetical protein
VTRAQRIRMDALLDYLRPVVTTLREEGWPAQVEVNMNDDLHPVVTVSVDVDDTRRPIESCIEWRAPA